MNEAFPQPRTDKVAQPWFRWTYARFIAYSRLPQVSAFIPAIGYALLWSDQFSELLNKQTLGESMLGLSVHTKLQLLWWGALLMTVGWLAFLAWCPKIIKRSADPEDYVIEQFQVRSMLTIAEAVEQAKAHIAGYHPEEKRPLLLGGLSPFELRRAIGAAWNPPRRPFEAEYAHGTGRLLTFRYYLIDQEAAGKCRLTLSLLVVGGLIFLLPSLDVFLRVVRKFFVDI